MKETPNAASRSSTPLPVSPMDGLFRPRSIAVVGATEAAGTVGRALMENLRVFPGAVYPVNPKRPSVLGRHAFPSILGLPETPDLAVIATPAASVPGM